MQDNARRRLARLVLGLTCLLAACAHEPPSDTAAGANSEINTPPANYKRDILAAMHAYLSDPTAIRDAGIAEPALKAVGNAPRYVVCLRFNAKKRGNEYARHPRKSPPSSWWADSTASLRRHRSNVRAQPTRRSQSCKSSRAKPGLRLSRSRGWPSGCCRIIAWRR